MGSIRIADADAPRAARHGTKSERFATRMGALVASPIGVLIIVPTLVAAVGGFLAASNERALRQSNIEAAGARLDEQARLVAGSVRGALAQAEPMLDQLKIETLAHETTSELAPFAHVLADLLVGRDGVAYVSASYPDGTFIGAYRDDDGVIRVQDSRVAADGSHGRRFDLVGAHDIAVQREETTTYDPRTRDFYRLAVARGERVTTDPYPFFGTMHTGITRAEPLYRGEGDARVLHAVITVDFDVNAMSAMLQARGLPGTRVLLHGRDGTVLAYSHARAGVRAPNPDHVLRYTDFHDEVLDVFFTQHRETVATRVHTREETFLVATARASNASVGWQIAFMAPESLVLGPLRTYERRSAIVAAFAVLIAMLLAVVFARHITRTERAAEAARAEALEAQNVARELGSYRLVSLLGKGGMGEVWRAEHRLLTRAAAIKLVNPDVAPDRREELRARFRREAQALAALRSRNTIEIYDYGVTHDGTFFYVMELLDGVDLESLVNTHGPQPAERVAKLLVQVCASLAEAHEAGMVHRDIKPANIFVCRAADELDIVRVLDFGLVRNSVQEADAKPLDPEALARAIEEGSDSGSITRVGGLLGTPAFMPKEQALGEPLDARADLYALGGVAFFLLTGRLVFDHPNPMTMLFMHLHLELPDLRAELPPSVPDAFVALITSCLAKDPAGRPASARALGEALRAIRFEGNGVWTAADERQFWESRERAVSRHETVQKEIESAQTMVSAAR